MKKLISVSILLAFIFAVCVMCTVYFFDLYNDIVQRGVVMDDATRAYLAELIVEGVVCLMAALSCIACFVIQFISYRKSITKY